MINDQELAELERLCREATPGPWTAWATEAVSATQPESYGNVHGLPRVYVDRCAHLKPGDAAFIAGAKDALPRLLAEVRRLRATPSPLARLEAWRTAVPTRTVSLSGGFMGIAEYRAAATAEGEPLRAQVGFVAARAEDRPTELGDAPPHLVYLGPGATFEAMITAALDRWEELHANREVAP